MQVVVLHFLLSLFRGCVASLSALLPDCLQWLSSASSVADPKRGRWAAGSMHLRSWAMYLTMVLAFLFKKALKWTLEYFMCAKAIVELVGALRPALWCPAHQCLQVWP